MRSLSLLAATLLTVPCFAQGEGEAKPTPTPAPAPAPAPKVTPKADPHFVVRRYPQDKDAPIAIVGGKTLTLGELVDHIDARHNAGFREALVKLPTVQAMLQSDLIAPWVRHFADLEALRQTFGTEIDATKLEAAQSEALKASFQTFLETYSAERRERNPQFQLTPEQVAGHLARFQWHNGLAAELQGMLDHLESGEANRVQLTDFYNDNARAFGGQVTVQHILIQNRDGGTGILLNDEGLGRANAKLADIKARLRPDGSNFGEVALRSDDLKTAKDGGHLRGLHRYDDRMPAALCRAAWTLRDGEISDVVETQYGWHVVRRIEFNQNIIMYGITDDTLPVVRMVMRRAKQEDRLFTARAKAGVQLLM
jgi:hypothetical protein